MTDLDLVVEKLRVNGYKMTPQRRELLRVLCQSDDHQSAQEMHERIRETFPDVSLDTVYRNLRLLTELGLVNQINLKSTEAGRYELDGKDDHHHHLVCLGCGSVFPIDYCPVMPSPEILKSTDFRVVDHAFEIYGYCSKCMNRANKNDNEPEEVTEDAYSGRIVTT